MPPVLSFLFWGILILLSRSGWISSSRLHPFHRKEYDYTLNSCLLECGKEIIASDSVSYLGVRKCGIFTPVWQTVLLDAAFFAIQEKLRFAVGNIQPAGLAWNHVSLRFILRFEFSGTLLLLVPGCFTYNNCLVWVSRVFRTVEFSHWNLESISHTDWSKDMWMTLWGWVETTKEMYSYWKGRKWSCPLVSRQRRSSYVSTLPRRALLELDISNGFLNGVLPIRAGSSRSAASSLLEAAKHFVEQLEWRIWSIIFSSQRFETQGIELIKDQVARNSQSCVEF